MFGIIYVKERKLTSLTISHILTDIVGFGAAFLR
ncbi:MAG: hypothetical protein DRJ45_05440 [Thermoprotei archaeon]|nr:MAG: hypothetical protein DRJ45_05440 [Thermoprotei archaeon]